MPKDYAKHSTHQRRTSGYIISLACLALCFAVTAIIVLYLSLNHLSLKKANPLHRSNQLLPIQQQATEKASQKTTQKTKKVATSTLKFDFYKLLSNSPAALKLKQHHSNTLNKPYILQVAASNSKEAALQLKERLSLLGFAVFISEHPGHLKYRVNVGGYRYLEQAMLEKNRLSESNFNSFIIKKESHS